VLCLAVISLFVTLLPPPFEQVMIPLSSANNSLGSVTIRYPAWQWAGDTLKISASFQLSDLPQGNSPVALTARLETAVEQINPRGEVRLAVQSNGEVTFTWQVAAFIQADYPGTLWVTLSTGNDHELLLARDLTLHSRVLRGLEMRKARIGLGVTGIMGVLMLAFSGFWPFLKRMLREFEN